MVEAAQSSTGRWTVGDFVGFVGGIAGAVGAFIAILSWLEARESRKIAAEAQALSRKSFDCSAGKGGAKFTVVNFAPTVDEIPQRLKFRSPFGTEEVRLESLDQLIGLNPCLTVCKTLAMRSSKHCGWRQSSSSG